MTEAILKYIFDQLTDKKQLFAAYATPWIFEDGRIYATDSSLLLCLENTEGRDKAFTDNGAAHPNVEGFIPPFNDDFKANCYVKLDALESFEGYCDLAGTSISDEKAKIIAKILRLFGMEGVVFGKTDHNRLIFEIVDGDKITGMLLCADQAKETNATLHFINTELKPMKSKLYDALINGDKGEEYHKKCLEKDKIEQEEYDRKNFSTFEVTLIRSKTICVKAESEEEAEKIALDNAYYIDFDDTCEVEACEESCRYDCCDTYHHYFDEKGKHDWND